MATRWEKCRQFPLGSSRLRKREKSGRERLVEFNANGTAEQAVDSFGDAIAMGEILAFISINSSRDDKQNKTKQDMMFRMRSFFIVCGRKI